MSKFTAIDTYDVRFPTSRELDGSDAMNPDPDYSAAYLILRTDDPDGLAGYGLVFTIGRGNDVQTAAISALSHLVLGRDVDAVLAAMTTSRSACRSLGIASSCTARSEPQFSDHK